MARTQIAVIPPTATGDFWKAFHDGIVKAQEETIRKPGGKPTIDILWLDPSASGSQIKAVEDAIAQKVAAIILAADDASKLNEVIERAKTKKIAVVIVDSPVTTENYKSYLTTDNKQAGELAAQHLNKLLSGKGKVLVVQGPSAAAAQRASAFSDAMKATPGIEVVNAPKVPDAPALAGVDGAFAADEGSTSAMLVLQQGNKDARKPKFVGFGASEKMVAALAAGEADALVLEDSLAIGHDAMKTAIDCIKEKKVEKRIEFKAALATKENADTPEIKALLHPDVEPPAK